MATSTNLLLQVILSGGATRLPCVIKKVQDYIGNNAEILSSISADEVIATGAAKQVGGQLVVS